MTMTMTVDITGCHKLLEQLYHDTINQNTNLMEILSIVKSSTTITTTTKSSSLPTIARGLQTKHSKLLSLINQSLKNLQSHPTNEKDIFKSFINEFIIWIDGDNTLNLFDKYSFELKSQKLCDSITERIINSPIDNLINLITFIDSCEYHLRNPFILDKLTIITKKLHEIITNHDNDVYYKKLNNILFSNVKPFTSNLMNIDNNTFDELVSSYFTIDQIIDRTADAKLYLGDNNKPIELMLLDLAGTGIYNSLAILSIDYNDDDDDDADVDVEISRSLMYPPFRINELSLLNTSNSIILKSIDFLSSPITRTTTTTTTTTENVITIHCDDTELIQIWVLNLSKIFPIQRNNFTTTTTTTTTTSGDDKFLLDSHHSSPINMTGLGINVISDSELKQNMSSLEEEEESISTPSTPERRTIPFRELIDSPTPTPLKKNSPSSNDEEEEEINEIVDNSGSTSNSSITSNDDDNQVNNNNNKVKLQSQYDRTVPLIKKTLSYNHQLDEDEDNDDEKYFQIINRKKISDEFSCHDDQIENRPKSSRGEVLTYNENDNEPSPIGSEQPSDSGEEDEDLISTKEIQLIEPNVPYHKPSLANSAPELNLKSKQTPVEQNTTTTTTTTTTKLYQLSTGSAVDINNFGKNYKPSFIQPIHNNDSMNSLISSNKSNKQKLKKRRSFFDLFKRSSKLNLIDDTPGFENIPTITTTTATTTTTNKPEKHETISRTVIEEEENADSKPISKPSSALPSPFALPSSTSTYFFKQYKENGSSSISLNKTRSTISLVSPPEQQQQQIIEEDELIIPQDLKDIINQDSTIDFFISPTTSTLTSTSSSSSSFSSSLKISKWKHQYGKWEMLTISEKIFIKIVINYQLQKCWFIVFKEEETDEEKEEEEVDEIIDKPILLLDISPNFTKIRKSSSSALDLQISSKNSITNEKILIMIRCNSGNLANDIINNIENALGVLLSTTSTSTSSLRTIMKSNNSYGSLNTSKLMNSDNTLASSMMDLNQSNNNNSTSHSSTYTSFSSSFGTPQQPPPPPPRKQSYSLSSLDGNEIYNANIINNPHTIHINKINQMQIRLQKLQPNKGVDDDDDDDHDDDDYQRLMIYNPSSWKILSMYKLNVDQLIDDLTQRTFYYFKLINDEQHQQQEVEKVEDEFRWLISDEMKFQVLEKIGKAGLLVKHNSNGNSNGNGEIYMIECRGKKEFKTLYEIFLKP